MFTQCDDYDDKTKKRKEGFSHVLLSLKSKHWTDFKTPSTHAPTTQDEKPTDAYPDPGLAQTMWEHSATFTQVGFNSRY